MKTLLTIFLLLTVSFTTSSLAAQTSSGDDDFRFLSIGYTVPIEFSNFKVKDGLAHSLTAYHSLFRTKKAIYGIVGIIGFDLDSPLQHIKQQMGAFGGFGRYMIQNQTVKSYLEVSTGVGFFRERFVEGKEFDPRVWEVVGNLFFGHLNLGGGIDIPFGKSKWHFGLGGALTLGVHKNGVSNFLTPRIVVSRY